MPILPNIIVEKIRYCVERLIVADNPYPYAEYSAKELAALYYVNRWGVRREILKEVRWRLDNLKLSHDDLILFVDILDSK